MDKNFKFRKDGRLIIDATYYDQHYPSKYFIVIDGKTYTVHCGGRYQTGKDVAKALVPSKYTLNPNSKGTLELRAEFYLAFPCSPKIDKYKLRKATEEEIREIKEKFDINKISDPFTETHISLYGEGEPAEERYVMIESPNAESIESFFIEKGISALTTPPVPDTDTISQGINFVKVKIDY